MVDVIEGYIAYRNSIRPTMPNTKKKQRDFCKIIQKALIEIGSSLETCTVNDLLSASSYSNRYKKNTRNTFIGTMKGIAYYLHNFHHPIDNLHLFIHDVKTGSITKGCKEVLTLEQWNRILNMPMSARDRAMLAMMYDGYHRPGEMLVIKWCDLRETSSGTEYDILFKTEKVRTISQKPGATAILETWRRECGAKLTDKTVIFGMKHKAYETNSVLEKLFLRLKEESGITFLKPSCIRNTAITHDVDAGKSVQYICLRAWGEAYNPMINVYAKPDSPRIQREQHEKDGINKNKIIGTSGEFSVTIDPLQEDVERLRRVMTPDDMIAFWQWKKDHV